MTWYLAWRRMMPPSGRLHSSTTCPSLEPSTPSRGPPTSSRPTRTSSSLASLAASSPPPAFWLAPRFLPSGTSDTQRPYSATSKSPPSSCTTPLIRAFFECPGRDGLESVVHYIQMLRSGVLPDNFTHPFVLRSCSLSSQLPIDRQVHAHVLKFGSGAEIYVVNNMLSMYSSCREMGDARRVFEEYSELVDIVSWTSLVTGYAKAGDIDVAKSYFDRMPRRNVISWNAMISGYAQSGRISDARKVFDMMPERDVSSWSAVISCYAQCKMCAEALRLFKEMVGGGVVANEAAVVSAVSACTQLRTSEWGTWLHEYTVDNEMVM